MSRARVFAPWQRAPNEVHPRTSTDGRGVYREQQEWHAHETEEVVTVVDGAATFFLGANQARIVRAGQIVRIPASVEHRYVAREGFRAVAARAE